MGLRLGTTICAPHICHHCGAEVSACGTPGISCKSSVGRHSRHAAINDIIHCTLTTAGILCRLEPPGLSRSNGKRPDGMSPVPWSLGRPLVWDATCPDTFATSYRGLATSGAGYAMAVRQHEWKHCMCCSNAPEYLSTAARSLSHSTSSLAPSKTVEAAASEMIEVETEK